MSAVSMVESSPRCLTRLDLIGHDDGWRVPRHPSPAFLSKLASGGKGDHVLGSLSVTHSEGVAGGADRSVRDR